MSEKHLTELGWKTLATKNKVKEANLTKALAALGKAGEKDAAAGLAALDEVEKHAGLLKKEHAKNDELVAYLGVMLKEAAKSRPLLEAKAKTGPKAVPGATTKEEKAETKVESEEEEDEEEDEEMQAYLKDLKKSLTAALSQVKSLAPKPGEDAKPQLRFMALLAGDNSAVVIARKAGGGTKKLLKTVANGASGSFASGECIFEKGAHTLVVDKAPGGLAKGVAKAILRTAGLSVKIRVRSADGEEEDSGSEGETEEGGESLAEQWKKLKTAVYPKIKPALEGNPSNRSEIVKLVTEASGAENAADFATAIARFEALRELLGQEPGGSGEDDVKARYEQRSAALEPRVLEALKAQAGDTGKMRAVQTFAQEKAEAGNYKAALQGLDALEKLLAAAGSTGGQDGGGKKGFSKVAFEQIHLDWDARKNTVQGALQALGAEIVKEFNDEEAASAAKNLEKVLATFNEGLGDTLDALRSAESAEDRAKLAGQANGIADRYLAYLSGNPLVAHVEANPYEIAVEVKSTLTAPLTQLKAQLAPLLA